MKYAIREECTKPAYHLITDIADMLFDKIKDLNPTGLTKEASIKLFEHNLIFLKTFGVLVFIIIALYRMNIYYSEKKVETIIGQWNFFVESILYGLFIAIPFYILMKIRKTTLTSTKILCYTTIVGVFFLMLNYIFEASGFMSFSFRNNNTITSNNYIVKETDSRLIIDDGVTDIILPEKRSDVLIVTGAGIDTNIRSKLPIFTGHSTKKDGNNDYIYTVSKNSIVKIELIDDAYVVSDYSLLSSIIPKAGSTAFEQFIEGFGFASKFIIGTLLMIAFMILVITIPLSQRDFNIRYKSPKWSPLLFFLIIETFIIFGIIGSLPLVYMAYNRYPDSDFLKSREDQVEFLKTFFTNVAIMSAANIVFQSSGFYTTFLG